MKRQKVTIGAILEINIEDQYYTYAQILEKGNCAFFDFRTHEKIDDFSVLEKSSILFIVAIYKDIITQGHWIKVGKLPIRKSLEILPMKFIQDTLQPNIFEFYNPNTGEITPAKKKEIVNLERAAVWEASHVEERIRDHYNGVPNIWVEQLKAK